MLESLVICLFVTEYRVSITFPQGAAIFGELPSPRNESFKHFQMAPHTMMMSRKTSAAL